MSNLTRVEMPANGKKPRCCVFRQISAGLVEVYLMEGPRVLDIFLVQEMSPTYVRRFKITKKLGKDLTQSIYWVSVQKDGAEDEDSCDCPGFESHGHCKHNDAIKAILASGQYVPYNDSPVQCFYVETEYENPA